ncbi:Uracil phosphoribosyltransferase [Weissella viridescens]|uniref:Uracil phosphoribosyltransferase n=1 Tax=Weissella viridescens TaxID=1629 RepID=A0A380NX04_WEIVI|nr:Uracil phosphoribosyltransferase [Weissella viridescens]
MSNLTVFEHPLIQHKLSIIRNKEVGTKSSARSLMKLLH